MNLASLAVFVLPPVLGAIIGYVTNAVAIKMLFRPYREWRVLGVRVPFTPGIIPRRRENLAESIARMVSDELLTEDTVLKQVSSPGFLDGLRRSIAGFTQRMLSTRIPEWLESEAGGGRGATVVKDVIVTASRSSRFRSVLARFLFATLSRYGDRRIDELVGDRRSDVVDALVGSLQRWAATAERRREVVRAISDWVESGVEQNGRFSDRLPPSLVDAVTEIVSGVYEPAAELLVEWLRSDRMREELERRGRFLLRDVLDRLTALQKLFVAAAQYDRQIEANMSSIVEDALDSLEAFLREDRTKEKLIELVGKKLRDAGVRKNGKPGGRSVLPSGHARRIVDALCDALATEEGGRALRVVLGGLVDPLARKTVAEVVSSFSSFEVIAERLSTLVCERIEALFSDQRGHRNALAKAFRDGGLLTPADLGMIDADTKDRLDSWLGDRVESLVRDRVPTMLRTLDVRALVVDRINGLDVEQVEGLLMRVIHRHLKWINVFGAILGFLIGTLQILTRLWS